MKIFVNKNYKGTHGFLLSNFLTVVISIVGAIAYIKNLTKNNFRLLIDAGLIFFGTQFFKEMWATYYFKNPTYFNNLASYYNNIGIVIIYSTFLFFFGQYDKYWRLKRLFFAVLISFIVSSIIYAMLPLSLRSSRILLMISASLAFFIPLITLKIFSFISHKIGSSNVSGNYLIVASKANADKIVSLINDYDDKNNILGFINPQNNISDDFFINSINNLSLVAKTIKADKIALCTNDLDNQTLLDAMVLPDSDIKYLIVNISNYSVLDSNDKNKSGSIFINQTSYKLSQKLYVRLKRLLDIIVSILCIVLFPLIVFKTNSGVITISRLFSILTGKMTWVGYSAQEKNKIIDNNLPLIKPSVIMTSHMVNNSAYFPLIKSNHEADIYYAKNYGVLNDLDIIYNFIFK